MTFLPIVGRELRVTARRKGTYWTRFTAATLAIVVGSFAWTIAVRESPRQTGFALFACFSVIAYIYSLLCGALATSDSVSEEKREGTLGLLFLTDLKSYDIVLGKLAASSLNSIYGLLAIFPVMGVPLLLGGVAPAEFWRVVLVCLNNLFFSLALGMVCSAICKDERKSIGLSLGLILLLTAGWPGIVAWISSQHRIGNPLSELFNDHLAELLTPSPGFACFAAFDVFYKPLPHTLGLNWFYVSLAVPHALGWLFLIATAIVLPRVWRDKASSPLRRGRTWRSWFDGSGDVRAAFRRRLLEINPFYWLASRDRFKLALVWLWMGAAMLIWMFGLIKARRSWLDDVVYVWTALIAHTFFKCWLPMEASRQIGADRRSGALELLLSTPLSVREILRGQWLALLRQFGLAIAFVCVADFVFLALILRTNVSGPDRHQWMALCFVMVSIFVFDLVTLALVSMWGSLHNRKAARAGLGAIGLVCVLPLSLFSLFGAGITALDEVFHVLLFRDPSGYVFLGAYFTVSFLTDAVLSFRSLQNLRTRFRIVATQRSEPRGGFWRRLVGGKTAPVSE